MASDCSEGLVALLLAPHAEARPENRLRVDYLHNFTLIPAISNQPAEVSQLAGKVPEWGNATDAIGQCPGGLFRSRGPAGDLPTPPPTPQLLGSQFPESPGYSGTCRKPPFGSVRNAWANEMRNISDLWKWLSPSYHSTTPDAVSWNGLPYLLASRRAMRIDEIQGFLENFEEYMQGKIVHATRGGYADPHLLLPADGYDSAGSQQRKRKANGTQPDSDDSGDDGGDDDDEDGGPGDPYGPGDDPAGDGSNPKLPCPMFRKFEIRMEAEKARNPRKKPAQDHPCANKVFPTIQECLKHLQRHHSNDHWCGLCFESFRDGAKTELKSLVFKNLDYLKAHINTIHLRPYKCTSCHSPKDQRYGLNGYKKHLKRNHLESYRKLQNKQDKQTAEEVLNDGCRWDFELQQLAKQVQGCKNSDDIFRYLKNKKALLLSSSRGPSNLDSVRDGVHLQTIACNPHPRAEIASRPERSFQEMGYSPGPSAPRPSGSTGPRPRRSLLPVAQRSHNPPSNLNPRPGQQTRPSPAPTVSMPLQPSGTLVSRGSSGSCNNPAARMPFPGSFEIPGASNTLTDQYLAPEFPHSIFPEVPPLALDYGEGGYPGDLPDVFAGWNPNFSRRRNQQTSTSHTRSATNQLEMSAQDKQGISNFIEEFEKVSALLETKPPDHKQRMIGELIAKLNEHPANHTLLQALWENQPVPPPPMPPSNDLGGGSASVQDSGFQSCDPEEEGLAYWALG